MAAQESIENLSQHHPQENSNPAIFHTHLFAS